MTDLIHLSSLAEVETIATHFVRSGFFKDARDVSQAVVKIMAGREVGLQPFAAMAGVQIIQGKPCFGASTLAALVQRSGKYRFRVVSSSSDACEIEFFEKYDVWTQVGVSEFTMMDANRAQLLSNPTWQKYPKAMLYARAMSQGVRMYCPEVGAGPVYIPEELAMPGANCNEDGVVIDATSYPAIDTQPVAVTQPSPAAQPTVLVDVTPEYSTSKMLETVTPPAMSKAAIVRAFDERAFNFGSQVKRSVLIRYLAGPHATADSDTALATLELPDSSWQRAVEMANLEVSTAQDAPIDPEPGVDHAKDEEPLPVVEESAATVAVADVDPFANEENAAPAPMDPTKVPSAGDIETMLGLAAKAGLPIPDYSGWTKDQVKSQARNYSTIILQTNAAAQNAKRSMK